MEVLAITQKSVGHMEYERQQRNLQSFKLSLEMKTVAMRVKRAVMMLMITRIVMH